MTGLLIILDAESAAVVVATTAIVAAHLREHPAEIAASWADGRAQLTSWAAAVERLARAVGAEAVAVAVALLALVLPAHGEHRREVA